MKARLWLAFALIVSAVTIGAVALLYGPSSVQAESSQPAASQPQANQPSAGFVIALLLPSPDAISAPPDLTPEQYKAFAQNLTYEQAQPVLRILERLRAEGQVLSFEIRPDLYAITFQAASTFDPASAARELSRFGYLAPTETELPECVQQIAEVLPRHIEAISHAQQAAQWRSLAAAAGSGILATNPTIDVNFLAGNSWSSISGSAAPQSTVSLRLLRGGSVLDAASTNSGLDGTYYFYGYSNSSCWSANYFLTALQVGDVVEVTAGGNTVSTVVAPLLATVDPVTNIVTGTTSPGRSVQISLGRAIPCAGLSYTSTVTSDGAGVFNKDYTAQVDFKRDAYAYIYARDVNGNSTYY